MPALLRVLRRFRHAFFFFDYHIPFLPPPYADITPHQHDGHINSFDISFFDAFFIIDSYYAADFFSLFFTYELLRLDYQCCFRHVEARAAPPAR